MSRLTPFPAVSAATSTAPIVHNLFKGPTIRKCEHGSYISVNETRALYCALCSPDGPLNPKDVVLPRSLPTSDHMLANSNSRGCPQCGSSTWLRRKESGPDTQRECADCGTSYRVRISDHQRAKTVQAEVEAECLG